MPILQLGKWENFEGVSLLDWNAPICLMATMLYPSNERLRAEAVALARAAKPYSDVASLNQTLANIVVERFAEAKPRQCGTVAGRILYLIRRIADHHPGYEASVHKAVSIIEAELESTPRSEREGWPASKTFIREAWASHKSVAHLWAALALSVDLSEDQDAHKAIGDQIGMLFILAIAEDFRHFAEAYTNRAGHIFEKDEMWRLPDGIHLPDDVVKGVPPLQGDLLEKLEKYRAPISLG